jgi:hypothetical protein
MTDEEKLAEEYVKSVIDVNAFDWKIVREICLAFLAGLKAGRPKWHDLRENINDIPPLDKDCERLSIEVVDEYGRVIIYDYESECWRDYEGDLLGLQPDFWCEIPTFTDKE